MKITNFLLLFLFITASICIFTTNGTPTDETEDSVKPSNEISDEFILENLSENASNGLDLPNIDSETALETEDIPNKTEQDETTSEKHEPETILNENPVEEEPKQNLNETPVNGDDSVEDSSETDDSEENLKSDDNKPGKLSTSDSSLDNIFDNIQVPLPVFNKFFTNINLPKASITPKQVNPSSAASKSVIENSLKKYFETIKLGYYGIHRIDLLNDLPTTQKTVQRPSINPTGISKNYDTSSKNPVISSKLPDSSLKTPEVTEDGSMKVDIATELFSQNILPKVSDTSSSKHEPSTNSIKIPSPVTSPRTTKLVQNSSQSSSVQSGSTLVSSSLIPSSVTSTSGRPSTSTLSKSSSVNPLLENSNQVSSFSISSSQKTSQVITSTSQKTSTKMISSTSGSSVSNAATLEDSVPDLENPQVEKPLVSPNVGPTPTKPQIGTSKQPGIIEDPKDSSSSTPVIGKPEPNSIPTTLRTVQTSSTLFRTSSIEPQISKPEAEVNLDQKSDSEFIPEPDKKSMDGLKIPDTVFPWTSIFNELREFLKTAKPYTEEEVIPNETEVPEPEDNLYEDENDEESNTVHSFNENEWPLNPTLQPRKDFVNEYPIIGVLAQEQSYALENRYPGQYKSFIAASYVKFLEGGGARVVPIWINKKKSYYRSIMNKINGVLFPGGATWFNQSNGYADAGWHIYQIAKEFNARGDYFPIWGACLGFELLTYLDANRLEHRDDCQSQNQALNLDFKRNFLQSRLFGDAPRQITLDLAFRPITSNFHRFCVTEQSLIDSGIAQNWNVLSTNRDWDGFTFISSIEHVAYPFYGVQFHPEKNLYEWVRGKNITHTNAAIRANQYFAQFFVNEARKSTHTFKDKSEEYQHLIYNFPKTFTSLRGSSYDECYMFRENVNYPSVSVRPSNIPEELEN